MRKRNLVLLSVLAVTAACSNEAGLLSSRAPSRDTRIAASVSSPSAVQVVAGNPTCADLGYDFGYKVDKGGTDAAGTYSVATLGTVTITTSDGITFDWSSDFGVDAVIAKGGNSGAKVYEYAGEATGGAALTPPDNINPRTGVNNGPAAISHIDFCFDVELAVAKTAATTYTRTFDWAIAKTATASVLTLTNGQASPAVDYTVTVANTHTDADWAISGAITITNPGWFPAVVTSVADLVSGIAEPVAVTCPEAAPFALQAGATVTCTYQAALPNADARVNTATVETDLAVVDTVNTTVDNTKLYGDGSVGGGAGQADVVFGEPTTVVGGQATVTDNLRGTLGTLAGGAAQQVYAYSMTFGPYATCGDVPVNNTATVAADGRAAQSASWLLAITVTGCQQTLGCTLTQGYWKTHSESGPAPYDDTWALLAQGAGTSFYLSGSSWLGVFRTAPAGNPYYNLAHQYMAAQLNVLNGASTPTDVANALTTATTLFGTYTPAQVGALKGSSTVKAQFTSLAGLLDAYNSGRTGPGHCSE